MSGPGGPFGRAGERLAAAEDALWRAEREIAALRESLAAWQERCRQLETRAAAAERAAQDGVRRAYSFAAMPAGGRR